MLSDNDAKQLGQKVKVNMRAKVNQAKSPFSLFSSVLPLLHLFLFLAPNVAATPASVWVLYSLSEYFSSCNDDDDDWIKLLCWKQFSRFGRETSTSSNPSPLDKGWRPTLQSRWPKLNENVRKISVLSQKEICKNALFELTEIWKIWVLKPNERNVKK